MKKVTIIASALLSLCLVASAQAAIKSQTDRLSYTIGFGMGHDFSKQDVKIDTKLVMKGLKDGLGGKNPSLSDKDMQQTMLAFQKQLIAKQKTAFEKRAADNLKVGEAFLAKNKTAEGVKTTKSGLQYKVIKTGTGEMPKANSRVTVNYEGKTIAGKIFDSSYKKGKPVTFPVSQVIPGWTEALQIMPVGSTWEIYVPAKLAYGLQGIGPIGPNEVLTFKLDLMKIEAAKKK